MSAQPAVPPPPPPPPAPSPPPTCSLCCPALCRRSIRDVLSKFYPLCDPCQAACRALTVYVAQRQAHEKERGLTDRISQEDDVSFARSLRAREMTIFTKNRSSPTVIEICMDRKPYLRDSSDNKPSTYFDNYSNCDFGLSVAWATGSGDSITWAKNCLAECERSHSQCRPPQSLLPKRVLDLQSISGCGNDVRLYETESGQIGRYVTLSHGWGETHPPKTLSSNIKENLRQISFASLSTKFRQVIAFVRGLGFRFLWIDSLCIVQDDGSDKMEQIPRMCEIYSHSVLTIAISHSKESTGECFSSPSPFRSGFYLYQGAGPRSDLLVREKFPHVVAVYAFDGEAQNDTYPLLNRAWVFQERYLSTRMLHFGSHELHWECSSKSTCECGIDDRTKFTKPSILSGGLGPYHLAFQRLVEYYSTLELSYEGDILLALQGIITRYESILGQRNIAGLWESEVVMGLFWKAISPTPRRRLAEAPTWSWASVVSTIRYEAFRVNQTGSIIIQSSTNPSVEQPVSSGYSLRVKGRIIEAALVYENSDMPQSRLCDQVMIPFSHDIQLSGNNTVYLFEIGWLPGFRSTEIELRMNYFLILRVSDHAQADIFERIGFLEMDGQLHVQLDKLMERAFWIV